MSKISSLFDYMRLCPSLTNLWSIVGEAERGTQVIFPRGSSPIYGMENEIKDVTGNYEGIMFPYPSIYEDFQINMYQYADPNDDSTGSNNVNVLSYQEVEDVCTWLLAQNANRKLPQIDGMRIISIEPTGTMPTVWGADEDKQIIAYAITVRLRYVNPNPQIEVEYECTD